ncbi:putative tetratricopeptide-like helical domain-containing protein [Rosa chinensis]|uniref:Putative tetratricopeptide-like helical domain-containing protein n=1 Tax=Rosa chinensis TaxID=74649 RepID=A0A2P6QA93_ROSCH|nr:putative tetratricopeptide-like helical domain-containing protein [Rosa chinensis]
MAESPIPEIPIIPERRKRKYTDDGDEAVLSGHLKRIVLSLSKPSTLLGIGATKPRSVHRAKLEKLLRKLVIHHNWVDASGVLSVLLGGGASDRSPANNRFMYWVLLEMVERLSEMEKEERLPGNYSKEVWIKKVFEAWEKKNGKMKAELEEYRHAVELERISLSLAKGNLMEAEAGAFGLMQPNGFRNDPLRNMIVGLTFQKLWYSKLPKEMQWREADQFYTRESNELVAGSEGHGSINSNEAGSAIHCDSDTSVMNDKVENVPPIVAVDADSGLHREISVEVDDMEVEISPPKFETQNFYADSAENSEDEAALSDHGGQMQYAPIFSELEGLESLLLPIRLPESLDNHEDKNIFNDYYKDAVKYLRHALHSSPPVLVALHPLIQLLLIGGQVKEALDEIEYCCNFSNTALPTRVVWEFMLMLLMIYELYLCSNVYMLDRLRSSLLQQFDSNNKPVLSTCLEENLRKDPTCCDSLEKLVLLHQNDNYSPESLLEMIALHLDATNAEYNIWREYAMCFLKLSQYEEDRMSVCLNGNEGGHKPRYSVSFNKTPKIFIKGQSGKNWKLRCRWWSTRHFSHDILASEIAAGDLELLTYKAASAVHMYGSEFYYVVDALCCLEKESERDLLCFLQMHIRNSVRIYSNSRQRTN